MFDIMKHINTLYYNNRNIETLTSKNIITNTAKTIKIIKLSQRKKSKTLKKEEARKKTKIIIFIALIMGKKFNQRKKKVQ